MDQGNEVIKMRPAYVNLIIRVATKISGVPSRPHGTNGSAQGRIADAQRVH